jgi:hypothetical protein
MPKKRPTSHLREQQQQQQQQPNKQRESAGEDLTKFLEVSNEAKPLSLS